MKERLLGIVRHPYTPAFAVLWPYSVVAAFPGGNIVERIGKGAVFAGLLLVAATVALAITDAITAGMQGRKPLLEGDRMLEAASGSLLAVAALYVWLQSARLREIRSARTCVEQVITKRLSPADLGESGYVFDQIEGCFRDAAAVADTPDE